MIYVEGGDQVNALPAGPSITSLTPAAGPTAGGQRVTVRGVGFQTTGMTATIGGISVTPSAVTATSFAFTTPAATAGYSNVQVADGLGTSALTAGSGYIYTSLSNYVPVTPFRILDTRSGTCIQCGPGALGPGSTRTVQITGVSGLPSGPDPIPGGATAVVLNVTAVNGTVSSLLTVFPNGTGRPQASSLNFSAHSVTANLVTVALGQIAASDGNREVNVYNSVGSVDVVADVEGYFEAQASSVVTGEFHPMTPVRVCDTRTACGTQKALVAGRSVVVTVNGGGGIPSSGTAEAAVLDVTGVVGTAGTYLSVFPTTATGTCAYSALHPPPFSTLSLGAGAVRTNRVIVALGPAAPGGPATSVCVYDAAGTINVVLDANGWFGSGTAGTGDQYQAIGPSRICDTRAGSGLPCSGRTLGPLGVDLVAVAGAGGVPSGSPLVQAVFANLTAVAPTQATYLTLYAASLKSAPMVSDLNVNAGQVLPNLALVQLDTTDSHVGDVNVFNAAGSVNVVIDVEGWFQ